MEVASSGPDFLPASQTGKHLSVILFTSIRERILTSRLEDHNLHLGELYIFFFFYQVVGKYAFQTISPCCVTGDPFLGSNNAPIETETLAPTYIALDSPVQNLN